MLTAVRRGENTKYPAAIPLAIRSQLHGPTTRDSKINNR
jgi:hypothetical protein